MIRATLPALLAICYAAFHCPAAQAQRVELDHVVVVVQPGAAAEIAALQSAGLTVASRVAKHPGQGTASRAVLFENAYLELIWVDSSVAVDAEHASASQWFRDAAAWRTSGHSPFGLGLRRLPGETAALPVPVKRESAEWLEPGTAYELLRQPGDSVAAEFFVVPANRSLPDWIASVQERAPQLLRHPGGGHKITRVRVHGPAKEHPSSFRVLLPKPVEMVRVVHVFGGGGGGGTDVLSHDESEAITGIATSAEAAALVKRRRDVFSGRLQNSSLCFSFRVSWSRK